jgi:hypothetical protein
MFQFGKILTLGIAIMVGVYLLLHRRQIRAVPSLRPFVGPFLLMSVWWLVTVVEMMAIWIERGAFPSLLEVEHGLAMTYTEGVGPPIFYLLGHLLGTAGYVWLLLVVWRMSRSAREAPR